MPAAEFACARPLVQYTGRNNTIRGTYRLGAGAARGGGRARRAASAVASNVGGCGGRKKGDGERGEDGEAREHVC